MKGFQNAWLDRDEPAGNIQLAGWTRATEDDLISHWMIEDRATEQWLMEKWSSRERAEVDLKSNVYLLPKLKFNRKSSVWEAVFPCGTRSFESLCGQAAELMSRVTGIGFMIEANCPWADGADRATVKALPAGECLTVGYFGIEPYADRAILAVSPSLLLEAGVTVDGGSPLVQLANDDGIA